MKLNLKSTKPVRRVCEYIVFIGFCLFGIEGAFGRICKDILSKANVQPMHQSGLNQSLENLRQTISNIAAAKDLKESLRLQLSQVEQQNAVDREPVRELREKIHDAAHEIRSAELAMTEAVEALSAVVKLNDIESLLQSPSFRASVPEKLRPHILSKIVFGRIRSMTFREGDDVRSKVEEIASQLLKLNKNAEEGRRHEFELALGLKILELESLNQNDFVGAMNAIKAKNPEFTSSSIWTGESPLAEIFISQIVERGFTDVLKTQLVEVYQGNEKNRYGTYDIARVLNHLTSGYKTGVFFGNEAALKVLESAFLKFREFSEDKHTQKQNIFGYTSPRIQEDIVRSKIFSALAYEPSSLVPQSHRQHAQKESVVTLKRLLGSKHFEEWIEDYFSVGYPLIRWRMEAMIDFYSSIIKEAGNRTQTHSVPSEDIRLYRQLLKKVVTHNKFYALHRINNDPDVFYGQEGTVKYREDFKKILRHFFIVDGPMLGYDPFKE